VEDVVSLAALDVDDDLMDDAPISVLSVAYCEDAFFG
jgi:hypothetical protein